MKILLSNYRYFISGGPERYLFSIKEIFERNKTEVFPFSVKSGNNEKTEWVDYFLSPVSTNDSTYFQGYKKDLKTVVKTLERVFYSPEGFLKARRYAMAVKPDLVYSLHFLNKMSPSIIDGFKSFGLPVVVRLSDFGLICPQAHFFCGDQICEECIGGSLFNAVKNKCIQDSVVGSLIKYFAWNLHRMAGSIDRIDAFVSPSKFTIRKYVEAGFSEKKFRHIQTFIDSDKIEPSYSDDGYILYFGRLVKEKGAHLLLDAYNKINGNKPRLMVIGDIGGSAYSADLVNKYSASAEFLEFMPKTKLIGYIQRAKFVVIPSVCYDNLPNALLESFACGKAVIASGHGCFNEFVKERETGLLFEPNSVDALKEKIVWAMENPLQIKEMGMNAREVVESEHTPQKHYETLMELFTSLLN